MRKKTLVAIYILEIHYLKDMTWTSSDNMYEIIDTLDEAIGKQ